MNTAFHTVQECIFGLLILIIMILIIIYTEYHNIDYNDIDYNLHHSISDFIHYNNDINYY